MSHERLLALTEEIYDAAAGSTPWTVVEAGLKSLVQARTASLMVGDALTGQTELLWREGFPDSAVAAYQSHYRHLDLWTTRAAAVLARGGRAAPIRLLIGGEMLVPDHEFVRSEFYNDFGRPLGLRHVLGTVVPLGEAGMMPIGLHRPDNAAPFGEAERRLVDGALPHLRRAMQLRHRLKATAGTAGLAALDALPLGVLVLDATMRVLVANTAAETMAAAHGAALRLQQVRRAGGAGSCTVAVARHNVEDVRFAALVRQVAKDDRAGGALGLSTEDRSQRLAALVAPLPRRLAGRGGAEAGAGRVQGQALVLLRDLSPMVRTSPRADMLRDLFGLTRAEAEVAQALTGGTSTVAVAARRGLSEATVRSQVRAVLDKTGAANLRDLERLLTSLQGM